MSELRSLEGLKHGARREWGLKGVRVPLPSSQRSRGTEQDVCVAAARGSSTLAEAAAPLPQQGPCFVAILNGRHLAGQWCLLQGHEHRAQAGHVFALLAALGVKVTQLGHLFPLRAWGLLLGFLHKGLFRCPEGGEKTGVFMVVFSWVTNDLLPSVCGVQPTLGH